MEVVLYNFCLFDVDLLFLIEVLEGDVIVFVDFG